MLRNGAVGEEPRRELAASVRASAGLTASQRPKLFGRDGGLCPSDRPTPHQVSQQAHRLYPRPSIGQGRWSESSQKAVSTSPNMFPSSMGGHHRPVHWDAAGQTRSSGQAPRIAVVHRIHPELGDDRELLYPRALHPQVVVPICVCASGDRHLVVVGVAEGWEVVHSLGVVEEEKTVWVIARTARRSPAQRTFPRRRVWAVEVRLTEGLGDRAVRSPNWEDPMA